MKNKFYYPVFILIILLTIFTRFFKISTVPPSLYWEEVALGYDAYSIAQTGKDHHGNFMPIVAFESFGDWKPSGYFYALVPSVAIFGLTEVAVRLPSMIAGVLLVIVTGQVSGLLALNIKNKNTQSALLVKSTSQIKNKLKLFNPRVLVLISMFVMSISPWAVMFSRAGWEVNLATLFLITGLLSFLKLINIIDNPKNKNEIVTNKTYYFYLFPTVILFVLSMYTYHSTRLIIPLLLIGMIITWIISFSSKALYELKNRLPILLTLGILAVILLLPLGLSLTDKQVNQRFAETSIFTDLSVIEKSNELKDSMDNSSLSRVLYHRYVLFSREILTNYLSHFKIDFLFADGDENPRHSTQYFGHLYHIEFIFILAGLYFIIKNRNKYFALLMYLLFIGVIPASITLASPHALRILPVMPVFIIIISFGIIHLFTVFSEIFMSMVSSKNKNKKQFDLFVKILLIAIIVFTYALEFIGFWHHYIKVYPQEYADQWQSGYKNMVLEVNKKMDESPEKTVYISRKAGRPAMNYWFYSATNPKTAQEQNDIVKKDQGEFLEFYRNGSSFNSKIKFEEYGFSKRENEREGEGDEENREKVVGGDVIVADYEDGEWVVY